jgi:ABC-type branched-subunit amino acid transport system ATPase component
MPATPQETHGLTKRFGENVAVNGVDLLVPTRCAFGYLGPNGAGKTTLIRMLQGLTHVDAGTMRLLGYPVPRLPGSGCGTFGRVLGCRASDYQASQMHNRLRAAAESIRGEVMSRGWHERPGIGSVLLWINRYVPW